MLCTSSLDDSANQQFNLLLRIFEIVRFMHCSVDFVNMITVTVFCLICSKVGIIILTL